GGEQRVAVGRSGLHGGRREAVAAAALVLNDDVLPPFLRQPLRDGAGQHVGQRAGRRGHHDRHGAARVGLRGGIGKRRRNKSSENQQADRQFGHGVTWFVPLS